MSSHVVLLALLCLRLTPLGGAVTTYTRVQSLDAPSGQHLEQKRQQAALFKFIRRVPKAELHVHIEGTLEPEMMIQVQDQQQQQQQPSTN